MQQSHLDRLYDHATRHAEQALIEQSLAGVMTFLLCMLRLHCNRTKDLLSFHRSYYQAETLWGFMGVSAQQMYGVLYCPAGFLVAGYQARAYSAGIDYLDVSGRPTKHVAVRLL